MNQIYDNLNTLANNKEFIICKSVGQELCERKLIELSSEMMEDVNKDLQAIDQFIKFKRLLLRSIMNFASKYLDKSKQMMLVHEL